MNDLAVLTGRPRRHTIGGRVYLFYPLTLGALGRLQEWLDTQTGDVDDAVYGRIGGLNLDQTRYVLTKGVRRVERGRVLLGTREAAELTDTVGGITELLYLSVRRGRRGFTRREAGELYWHLDAAGLRKLWWAIWGVPPEPSDPDDDQAESRPPDWWAIYHRLAGEPFGYSPKQIGGMTWPQVVAVLGEGKPPQKGLQLDSMEAVEEYRERRRTDPWF